MKSVVLGSTPVHTEERYLFSIRYEFFIYPDPGANGRNVTNGALALSQRGPPLARAKHWLFLLRSTQADTTLRNAGETVKPKSSQVLLEDASA